MKMNLAHAVGRVRFFGMLEGLSFLLLLFVAMPLKYFFDYPIAVRYVGMAHGLLFVLFVFLIMHAWLDKKLSAQKAGLAFLASLIPFGPFLIDSKLSTEEAVEAKEDDEPRDPV